jgi:hypothetical protein
MNCHHAPLSCLPATGFIIAMFFLPELHLNTGVTNKIFREFAKEFPKVESNTVAERFGYEKELTQFS